MDRRKIPRGFIERVVDPVRLRRDPTKGSRT